MQKLFPEHILKRLFVKNQGLSKNARNILFYLAIIFMTFALARPVIEKKEQSIKQEITPIVVAIDVSKSMLASDIEPSRLALAKRKLQEIIKQSPHNAVGVLLFAKSAFILSPITQDFTSLNYLVERFDQGLNFDNGSNIYAVIEAANKLFSHYNNKNLLLLTDGANKDSFEEEIALANEHNIAVYTLALATDKPTPIKLKEGFLTDKNNNIVMVKRNDSIKTLSFQTNGGYIEFSLDNSDITAILQDIETKSAKDQLNNKKVKTYTELFYYPLALSLFLLFIAFSSLPRKAVATLFLSLVMYSPNEIQASILDFKTIEEANTNYKVENYDKASKAFKEVATTKEGHYNYANALYKNKKYKEALKEYKKVITSEHDLEFKKLHNMGNTYVKLNQLQDAIKMYEKALSIKEDKETKENLERVKEALQQNDNNSNQNKQNNKNQEEKEKDSQEQNQQDNQNKNEQENKQNKPSDANNEPNKQDKEEQEKEEKQKHSSQENKQQKDNSKNTQDDIEQAEKTSSKEEIISDLEEQKWLRQLQQKKTPVLLRKVESSKEAEENSSAPW